MIILSAHAQEMMAERRIELDWVVLAINFPERTEAYAHKTYSFRKIDAFGGRTLKVVHRPRGSDIFVITAHFDRGIRP